MVYYSSFFDANDFEYAEFFVEKIGELDHGFSHVESLLQLCYGIYGLILSILKASGVFDKKNGVKFTEEFKFDDYKFDSSNFDECSLWQKQYIDILISAIEEKASH